MWSQIRNLGVESQNVCGKRSAFYIFGSNRAYFILFLPRTQARRSYKQCKYILCMWFIKQFNLVNEIGYFLIYRIIHVHIKFNASNKQNIISGIGQICKIHMNCQHLVSRMCKWDWWLLKASRSNHHCQCLLGSQAPVDGTSCDDQLRGGISILDLKWFSYAS